MIEQKKKREVKLSKQQRKWIELKLVYLRTRRTWAKKLEHKTILQRRILVWSKILGEVEFANETIWWQGQVKVFGGR